MTTILGRRSELIDQIEQYDKSIKTYNADDQPKTKDELGVLSIPELEEWLKTRMTQYQFEIDQDIEIANAGCAN